MENLGLILMFVSLCVFSFLNAGLKSDEVMILKHPWASFLGILIGGLGLHLAW